MLLYSDMATINQLIKRKRNNVGLKNKTAALTYGFNSLKNRPVPYASPFKRGICVKGYHHYSQETELGLAESRQGQTDQRHGSDGLYPGRRA